ncbi:MAG: ECF transporter S component [Ruminococcaceae bacterium]|nr:ECF transporter S component [Oscillospiraceae bacterium]
MKGSESVNSKHLIRLCQASCLAAVALVLVYFIHFPLIPAAPFLEYDMADVPVLLVTVLFGPLWGGAVLTAVSLVQAFMLGGNGWVGAVMHIVSSGVLVLIVGMFSRRSVRPARLAVGLLLGTLAMATVMVPMNLTLTVYFLGTPRAAVIQMLLPAIVPFNLLKAGINSALTAAVYTTLRPLLRRQREMLGVEKEI